jgi:putative mycofactocin binding protein MftB
MSFWWKRSPSTGCAASIERTEARPAAASFAVEQAWQLNPQVALRDETFGALAYHYGNRRLVFLKSRRLVELVSSLGEHPSAASVIAAKVPAAKRDAYARALARLAASEVFDAR